MLRISILASTIAAGAALAAAFAPAAAADTITYYTLNSGTAVQVAPHNQVDADVYCNTGDYATGGGALLEDGYWVDEPYMRVVQSGPVGVTGTDPAPAWRVTYDNSDVEDAHGFMVYVICEHTTIS